MEDYCEYTFLFNERIRFLAGILSVHELKILEFSICSSNSYSRRVKDGQDPYN